MITYTNKEKIAATDLAQLFEAAGIHRPIKDLPRLKLMLDNADIIWTAWDAGKLVGIARALTDFSYACYLSDLAVAKKYQKQGIGKNLVERVHTQIGPDVALLLLASPAAQGYYPKLKFENIENAFLKKRRPFA
ncbi:GNAT family N-acetyltransferase [Liquorilactobacillus satsumensis]|uniref:GCN5-like N-acetyltransferase n=1 Tax=Liquorilactobacillus satsumensis DSM 16230 = JCM 12392 TaxID=1423801 RepID=A0A0R1UVK0_9LACO|nr:GNAT family N-acetyltransferase [Liquorilactobacillus satsumensis]KRL97231.1 GCN5-like N-acetyltransferase [Liquorilactobacillus satsumensis DSM 16230 = JCM 12392]MCC7666875.1 N-acetyltransferase [Liquorilactobacillus satsumensis]MCP9313653.1 GNAT family N-acetyltransferase [Liquorilactobacillus satsumensis]MCP9328656.1 GNAT family N-acetyltransferase [Liquorilactobacillus satsumensis]MCP9356977.1 GNAT family N-acetyltransferase [Liquorilactobacillus satsumensis]